jgi:hypothetical protein
MVKTCDERRYHAPTKTWKHYKFGEDYLMGGTDDAILNEHGKYVAKFAENHGISIDKANEEPMVKAHLAYYNSTLQSGV